MRKRKHSPEFLEQAVKQTLTGNELIKDMAAGLGISYWIPLEAREYLSASSGFNEKITMPVSAAMRHNERRRGPISLVEGAQPSSHPPVKDQTVAPGNMSVRGSYQMKNEVDRKPIANQEEAKCEIFDYIEVFYNRKRSHSYLGYLSPEEFETKKVA